MLAPRQVALLSCLEQLDDQPSLRTLPALVARLGRSEATIRQDLVLLHRAGYTQSGTRVPRKTNGAGPSTLVAYTVTALGRIVRKGAYAAHADKAAKRSDRIARLQAEVAQNIAMLEATYIHPAGAT